MKLFRVIRQLAAGALMPALAVAQAPTVTSLNPGSGPLGTSVTLGGSNLTGLTSVQLGGVPAAFTVQSASQATATVPRGAVSQRVRVTSAAGTALSPAAFQVTRPSPSLVLPGGTSLTTDGSTALDVGTYATPTVTDLDGDGLLDLLVGHQNGQVSRFTQAAVNSAVFGSRVELTTDGGAVLDVASFAAPAVADLDGNGRLDLLVGNRLGQVLRFEQTAAGNGSFASAPALTTDGSTALTAGTFAVPVVTDVDGNGLLDLLVGNYDGQVLRFEQSATGSLVLTSLGPLATNAGTVLDVGAYATPAVTDLDGDGLLDLLVGTYDGQVRRFEQAPVPTLTALSRPAELPGQAVTLTGMGFVAGSTVRFGGVAAASVSYTSATQLTAVVPVGATPGSSALTVGSYDVSSAAGSSPAFEVLQVYRSATPSACLSTDPLPVAGTGGAGVWRYLRLAGAGGPMVAAIEDTRNLGTVAAQVLALGTATTQPVRTDSRLANRPYLDRNFTLATSTALGTGNSVRVRFFGLTSELSRLTAADPTATASSLQASQYSGPNEDCDLANNGTPADQRLLAAPATVFGPADWFTAEATVTDHFSEFYLTGASTPLPVQLVAFTAQPAGPAAVQLTWTTASEANSAAFEVQRSADSTAWQTIGTVAAAGSSATLRRYAYLDAAAPTGRSYYRLRQVDVDGSAAYSPVRTVTLGGAGLALYSNPAPGAAILTGATPGAAVRVLDALGRVAATATVGEGGTAVLGGLAPGLYVVRCGAASVRLAVE